MQQATYPSAIPPYPVRVEGRMVDQPSRWLWLIKWLLVLPHVVVLAVLWLAFLASSTAALVTVLFTGRYPRSLFGFNVGVLRWTWRVVFYAYGANGTDRYPPFTLAEVPDYPARLQVAFPEHQRRGLPLLGWWLAGVPQYLIVGAFVGGGVVGWLGAATRLGLIGLLVLVGAVVLLVRGTYPRAIFDLVLGLNRWVLRVIAYAAIMTPEYPPFRLDAGPDDPAGAIVVTPGVAGTEAGEQSPSGWGAGRIIATVLASITALVSIAAIATGATALVYDQTQRDASGYLMSSPTSYSTDTYALESDSYRAPNAEESFVARALLGTIRIRAQSTRPVFVGIAPAYAADAYLAGVAQAQATRFAPGASDFRVQPGGRPIAPPSTRRFWVASATGAGVQTLTWRVRSGDWRVIVMNADGTRDVASELSIGASSPYLLTIAGAALGAGIFLLLLSGGALYLTFRTAHSTGRRA